ncbi:MAG TPA: hypothetical protein VK025_14780 [Steroidobacter sp.]|jgi:hypothetical protein|nr:hypothetical protein [Steroidobacteraceae bacterium]HLS82662.1 hypothetical protein [Steroidobacter sp.]
MKTILALGGVSLLAFASTAQGLEWRIGMAYASGVDEVADLYENNLRLEGFEADVDLKLPIGLTAGVMYDWASGVRGDLGLGPAFFIGGDVDHFELPLSATVGYNFLRDADASPYVRAGVVYHFASGDYYSSSDPGLFAAVGLDFRRFSLEVSLDSSEVELDTFACAAPGAACASDLTQLRTYDVVASFFWRFRTYRDPRRR